MNASAVLPSRQCFGLAHLVLYFAGTFAKGGSLRYVLEQKCAAFGLFFIALRGKIVKSIKSTNQTLLL